MLIRYLIKKNSKHNFHILSSYSSEIFIWDAYLFFSARNSLCSCFNVETDLVSSKRYCMCPISLRIPSSRVTAACALILASTEEIGEMEGNYYRVVTDVDNLLFLGNSPLKQKLFLETRSS